jgi:hypothetical protein
MRRTPGTASHTENMLTICIDASHTFRQGQ